ncbi:MAG TPA: hypothetical protein PLY23_02810, partial [Alphaproteobacteria bacterium]|nr:hypothetical protein [Alphaproteobacteria bacterium]
GESLSTTDSLPGDMERIRLAYCYITKDLIEAFLKAEDKDKGAVVIWGHFGDMGRVIDAFLRHENLGGRGGLFLFTPYSNPKSL